MKIHERVLIVGIGMLLAVSCVVTSNNITPVVAGGGGRLNRLTGVLEVRNVINQSTLATVPTKPGSLNMFDRYSPTGDALWARGWRRRVNMTGVSTDSVRTCTLISPRHVLMAWHYQRNIGDTVTFHDASGRRIERLIEEKAALLGGLLPDIAVARLEREVPLPFYRVLPPRSDYQTYLAGALAIVTDKDRNLLVRQIGGVGGRRLRFSKAVQYPDSCADPLISGDSGNPSFVLIRSEPILIETHTFGGLGQGAFVSDPENFAGINALMTQVGGGYQLTTIDVGSDVPNPIQ
jgi:hypothetical protein